MSTEKQSKTISFSEIRKTLTSAKQLPNITDLINNEFIVFDFEIKDGLFGQYAVVKTNLGEYRTSSKVLINQLMKMQEYLDKGYDVKVTLRKRKRYYTFE